MPERSTEVQRRLDETGLDVKVSVTYTLKFTAGEVADAVLWLVFARVARVLTRSRGGSRLVRFWLNIHPLNASFHSKPPASSLAATRY
jgi:hypothetical protein